RRNPPSHRLVGAASGHARIPLRESRPYASGGEPAPGLGRGPRRHRHGEHRPARRLRLSGASRAPRGERAVDRESREPNGARVFLAERNTGNIRIIECGALLPTSFYTLTNTATTGERGLLCLALDPGFPSAPYVYAYQTYNDVANGTIYNRIVRISANGNVGTFDRVILSMPPLSAATNHNGGVIAFGPDGKLWALVGENANPSHSQDPTSLLGKVLRMNSDGSAASDNPFYGNPSWENRVYTYGHRNMFGIAWRPVTGRAYITAYGPA